MADLIDREELENEINKLIYYYDDAGNVCYKTFDILKAVDELPPADTERHAHWELIDNTIDTFVYKCSNCKDTIALPFGMIKEFNGCPYCLSRMDEVVE